MENEKIIEAIVDKINAGYDDYGIEKFLEHQEINSDEFDTLIEAAKNIILEHKLQTYPKQNKLVFIVSLALFVVFLIFFCIILPSLNIANGMIPLSILGAIFISFSGFYALLYYKSWEKSFIERVGKPKLDLQTYFIICTVPTILFYYIIFWSFVSGPSYELYKISITNKFIKFLFPK
ncbi:MAG TPA: hypothetical protein VIV55_00440 [Flavobacterium sp.]